MDKDENPLNWINDTNGPYLWGMGTTVLTFIFLMQVVSCASETDLTVPNDLARCERALDKLLAVENGK